MYRATVPDYRRHRVAGATYFFTVNLLDRKSSLLVEQIDVLRRTVARVHTLMPFHVDAWVVLPDHMHCLWTLPEDDGNFPRRWQAIKMGFSRWIKPGEKLSASRNIRGERGIGQRRYWEHTIRDEQDYATHMDYTHFNPVKHGYVAKVVDWEFSTFHRCIARGLFRETGPHRTAVLARGESAGDVVHAAYADAWCGAMRKSIAPYLLSLP